MTNENTIATSAEANADMDTESTEEAVPMRILKVATCPSLSSRSELTYHVGVNRDTNALGLRIWRNSASGMFSNSWTALVEVSKLLATPEPFTSSALKPLFESTSRNNPGFHLAVLQGLGLIEKEPNKRNTYCTASPDKFLASVQALIAAGVDLDPDDDPSDELAIAATEVPKRGRPKKQAT